MCDSAEIYSGLLPDEFLSRMRQLLTEQEYAAFLSCYGQKRLYSLRLNPLKADRDEAKKLLGKAAEASSEIKTEASEQEGDRLPLCPELQPVPWEPDGLYYPEWFRPGRLPWHEAGMYYIQEASAMAPAVLCDAQPGERVLDLCAAPGGKSTKLAASLQGRGILVANEIHPERARVLSSNLERMGVRNALVTNESPQRLASRFPLFFDNFSGLVGFSFVVDFIFLCLFGKLFHDFVFKIPFVLKPNLNCFILRKLKGFHVLFNFRVGDANIFTVQIVSHVFYLFSFDGLIISHPPCFVKRGRKISSPLFQGHALMEK